MIAWLKRLFSKRDKPANNTMDARTAKNLATLDPKAQPIFAELWRIGSDVAKNAGYTYVLICGNRTYAQQNALYAQGRTADGNIVTNAKGGYSNHNFGIAGDFGVFSGKSYLDDSKPDEAHVIHKAVAAAAAKAGLDVAWGGGWAFADYPHFEVRTTLSMAQKRARMDSVGSVL